MKKTALFAATLAGAVGLSLTSAFAAVCQPPVSGQPNHNYTEIMVPLKDVLHITKRRIYADGETVTMLPDGQSEGVKTARFECPEDPEVWVFSTTAAEFNRVQSSSGGNTIPVMIETNVKDDRAGKERKCLSVPVKDSVARRTGENEMEISFSYDETAEMRAERRGYIADFHPENRNLEVRCYNIQINNTITTMPTAVPGVILNQPVKTPEAIIQQSPQVRRAIEGNKPGLY